MASDQDKTFFYRHYFLLPGIVATMRFLRQPRLLGQDPHGMMLHEADKYYDLFKMMEQFPLYIPSKVTVC
jgi:hypothetical protein